MEDFNIFSNVIHSSLSVLQEEEILNGFHSSLSVLQEEEILNGFTYFEDNQEMPNILNNLEVETNFSTLANEEENVQDIGNAQEIECSIEPGSSSLELVDEQSTSKRLSVSEELLQEGISSLKTTASRKMKSYSYKDQEIINLPIIKFRNYIKEQGLSEVEIERLRKLRRYRNYKVIRKNYIEPVVEEGTSNYQATIQQERILTPEEAAYLTREGFQRLLKSGAIHPEQMPLYRNTRKVIRAKLHQTQSLEKRGIVEELFDIENEVENLQRTKSNCDKRIAFLHLKSQELKDSLKCFDS